MAELHQVVDHLADPVVVGRADDIEVGVGDPAADGDDGSLAVQRGECVPEAVGPSRIRASLRKASSVSTAVCSSRVRVWVLRTRS